jgi:glycosyltransferase involved in cell wall biosynthesis
MAPGRIEAAGTFPGAIAETSMPQPPLNLLCVEPHFPGRLGAVADWLVRRRGYRCWFFFHKAGPPETWPPSVGRGLQAISYDVGGVAKESTVSWMRGLERGFCYAYGAWEVFDARRPRPVDVVLGRSAGLGSTLFAPVSYPGVPVVNYFDHYLHPLTNDLADEDAPTLSPDYEQWRRSANAMDLLDLENGVVPWTGSDWQGGLYPAEYQADFVVLDEGVDARRFSRRRVRPTSVAGRTIPPGAKVMTFVSRVPDRLRGFDRFLALADRLTRERPDVICLVVGGGPVGRMIDVRHHGQDYATDLLRQTPLRDPSRVWTLGQVPPDTVADLLAASDLHVYASRPHPVSRSLLEAMAAGAVVLGWDSGPVREYLEPGRTGLLVPADDPEAAVRMALAALDDPAGHRPLGDAAAALARERFSQDVSLPRLAGLLSDLVEAGTSPTRGVGRGSLSEPDAGRPRPRG